MSPETLQTHNSSNSVNNWVFNKAYLFLLLSLSCPLKQERCAFFPSDYPTRAIPDPTSGLSPGSLGKPPEASVQQPPPRDQKRPVRSGDLERNKRCRAPAGAERYGPSRTPSVPPAWEWRRAAGEVLREGWTRRRPGSPPRAAVGPAQPRTAPRR